MNLFIKNIINVLVYMKLKRKYRIFQAETFSGKLRKPTQENY